jgi:hypothetical protein
MGSLGRSGGPVRLRVELPIYPTRGVSRILLIVHKKLASKT